MNKRVQAYMRLIEQLLGCSQGQEGDVLQTNMDLVDAGLVDVMGEYAAYLEDQGNNNARWLRRFARKLVFRITAQEETKDIARFFLETLQLVAENNSNPQRVYPVWAKQQVRFNAEFLEVMPTVTANLFSGDVEQRTVVAATLVDCGNLINQFPLGSRWLNLELGIAFYELALQVRTRTAFPKEWAGTQNNLALAYSHRIRGERGENLEQAIASYKLALEVSTRTAFPEQWATTQNNLAIAYNQRIRGDRADSLEQAIACYELALEVYTHNAFPEQWATTQNNLAIAYKERIRSDRGENLEKAIECCELALQIRTQGGFPEEWAATQNNLANAYKNRIRGERGENLEQAIRFYELALRVYTAAAFPEQWAMTQNNLAATYSQRIRGDRGDNLEQAIRFYELAQQVYTAAFPEQWATTQSDLANVHSERIRGDREDNLEQAIRFYQLALQVRTRTAFPEQWAITQNNLATAYKNRIRGDRGENIEQSIASYELALQVRTRDAFPEKWAMTQNNLATAYSDRIRGDGAENIEQAIGCYGLALQVYTCAAFPYEWATTQNNLAIAYKNRLRGNREKNLEWSIAAYELALQIRTLDTFPNDCRQTARNLGNLHFEQRNWRSALDAYATALAAAEILYQSCILLDGKAAELTETADLPRRLAYALAQTGNLRKAVETLEQCRARGLSESLDRDRANLNQLQQLNPDLYNQYRDLTEQLRTLESQQRDRMTSDDRHSLTPEVLRETAIDLRQQLNQLIPKIRQIPGYESFLTLPTFEEVRQSAKSDKPLVYLVTTPAGSLALIVSPEDIQSIRLNDLNDQQLQEIIQTWFAAYNQSHTDRQAWLNAIDSTTRQLWEPLMQPLIQHLKTHNIDQATLIPTGFLSLLPLHAAWTPDTTRPTGRHYALDDIHLTYAPNAKSLIAANAIAQTIHPTNILAIDNPTQNFANSEREINAAIETFPDRTVLRHAEATVENVRSKLSKASVVHFSCHGTANLNDPLNSGLLMSDGLLTLREILALNLAEKGGIRLAILSACETGLQGIENADEAISLPTGLLQAGVAATIASLWSVSDLSTMILLTRFYDFWRKENLEPSLALRRAQFWVRDTTTQEKAKYFKPDRPDLFRVLILLPPHEFAHPFHWSAFSYTGI